MSKIKFFYGNTEYNSNELTKNILYKDTFKLSDFNIYEVPKNLTGLVNKVLESKKNKASKILQIKIKPNWSKYLWIYKRNILLKEKLNKNNLVDYWISCNIFTNKNIINFLVYLKLDKYINAYFAKVFPNCDYPLFDEYELYKNKIIDNKLLFISKMSLFNSHLQNSKNNNNIPIINNSIKININEKETFSEEEYENSFIEDVNKFADEYENNESYNNLSIDN